MKPSSASGGNQRPPSGTEQQREGRGDHQKRETLTQKFNRASGGGGGDQAAIPPQPKLNCEPPQRQPKYPAPTPGGLSITPKAKETNRFKENLKKNSLRNRSLTQKFNKNSRSR